MHRQLARLRAEDVSFTADKVTRIERLIKIEVALANSVVTHVELHLLAVFLDMAEPGLTLAPLGHQPSADAHTRLRFVEFLRRLLLKGLADFGGRVRIGILARIRLKAEILDIANLVVALLK